MYHLRTAFYPRVLLLFVARTRVSVTTGMRPGGGGRSQEGAYSGVCIRSEEEGNRDNQDEDQDEGEEMQPG